MCTADLINVKRRRERRKKGKKKKNQSPGSAASDLAKTNGREEGG
jgi:hypothetical protein